MRFVPIVRVQMGHHRAGQNAEVPLSSLGPVAVFYETDRMSMFRILSDMLSPQ